MTVMSERSKTIDVPRGSARFQELCQTLLSMYVPDGYRAEIIGGNIVVSPCSRGYYGNAMRSIRSQLDPYAPHTHHLESAPFLFAFPGEERAYGPDVYAAAASAFDTDSVFLDGEALSLVGELTSTSTRDVDWGDKLAVYGRAGVPVYLLVDMQKQQTTVFWGPSENGYNGSETTLFGNKLRIPKPFDCDLDTAGFVRP